MTSGRSGAPGAPVRIADAHARSSAEALRATGSGPEGLSGAAAARLRAAPPRRGRRVPHWLAELAESVVEPLQLLLIVVGALSAVFGELSDAIAIFVVIAAVAVIETVNEVRAASAIAALQQLTAPVGRVRRDGTVTEVAVGEIVPGDVLELEAGDLVPADARVLGVEGLRVDESTLTGEAQAVGKGSAPVPLDAALAERTSMVYAGTAVVAGRGDAVVVAVGPESELGRLGELVAEEREPLTPLQQALRQLARVVLVAAVGASVLVPVVGLLAGQPPQAMLLAGLTLAFATVPEELPILVTVLLAVGGRQLARRGALLRRLRAGEALGAVTVVVSDKTGTLTENRLRLAEVVGDRGELFRTARITLGPRPSDGYRDPMDAELARAADEVPDQTGRAGEDAAAFPFDSETKTITRVRRSAAGPFLIATTGSPEAVLDRCAIAADERLRVEGGLAELTRRGLRVIAFAQRSSERVPEDRVDAERDLTFVGLVAFLDALRPGVRDAVAELRTAGVRTVVVTGDHPATASAVATGAGLPPSTVLLGGAPLGAFTDAELADALHDGTVVARATPADKLRIVRALQARGEVVAVTGDGVNDAPALAAADVGLALGRRGSDLARQAAGVVLTDDAYPTVAAAVESGRNLGAQLRRAVAFYLGAKLALVAAMVVPLALGLPAPFAPVHIVLLELFMDLGASVAFVAEPAAPGAMTRPPRRPGAPFLDRYERTAIGLVAAALTLATLPVYLVVEAVSGVGPARTAAVASWLIGHALVAWALRARVTLACRRNPAFPIWAAAAALTGLVVALSPAGVPVQLPSLPATALPLVAIGVVVAVGVAGVGSHLATLRTRL